MILDTWWFLAGHYAKEDMSAYLREQELFGRLVFSQTGHLLVTWVFWNFRFSDCRFSRFFSWKIFLKNILGIYRGINNKGVLERPGTKWRVLRAISPTLKCQFGEKCWKVEFPAPYTTKSAENWPGWTIPPVRTSRTSQNTPNSILNFRKNQFFEKPQNFQVTNKSLESQTKIPTWSTRLQNLNTHTNAQAITCGLAMLVPFICLVLRWVPKQGNC